MLQIKPPYTHWFSTISLCLVFSLFFSSAARADKFDDAVNHYLDGFEYCKDASGLLRSNQVSQAKSKMNQYDRYFKEAQKIDASIATSKKRGMEGNVLFCKRVALDLEVEQGTPFMDKAVEHCDLAKKALRADNPTSAQANLDQFKEMSAKAFEVAPGMKDIFRIASKVRSCERLQKKVARSSQKLESQNLSIETVKEESASYLKACQETDKLLKSRAIDDALVKSVGQGIASAKSHKNSTNDETVALNIFKQKPDHAAKPIVEGNLKSGDQCIAKLEKQFTAKKAQLKKIKATFAKYEIQIVDAQKKCNVADAKSKAKATETVYVAAKKSFQTAQVADRNIREALKADKNYSTYASWPIVKTIDKKLIALNGCIARTNKKIGGMFASLQKAKAKLKAEAAAKEKKRLAALKKAEEEAARKKAAADKEAARLAQLAAEAAAGAVKKAAQEKAKAAEKLAQQAEAAAALAQQKAKEEKAKAKAIEDAKRKATEGSVSSEGIAGVNSIKGVISFDGLIAKHAVIYVDDGSKVSGKVAVELKESGFDKNVYVAGKSSRIEIRNKSNSLHRLKAEDDVSGYSKSFARILPRQKNVAKVRWDLNSIVSIKSDRGALAETYIAHVASSNAEVLSFNVGDSKFDFEFKGTGKGVKAYLIMPGHDVVEFDFSKGSEQTKPITQNGAPVGSVKVSAK